MSDQPALQGMGTSLRADGVAFRVWAPHAKQVSVIGTFNNWDGQIHPMQPDQHGNWTVEVEGAKIGDQYKYQLRTEAGVLTRIDARLPVLLAMRLFMTPTSTGRTMGSPCRAGTNW